MTPGLARAEGPQSRESVVVRGALSILPQLPDLAFR